VEIDDISVACVKECFFIFPNTYLSEIYGDVVNTVKLVGAVSR
jgi:hypothetical protein